MNNSIPILRPPAPAARIQRAQRCENCGLHGIADDGKQLDCRFDPPKIVTIPTPQGMHINCMFPITRPEWFCGKWKPLVEQAASLGEAVVGTDK